MITNSQSGTQIDEIADQIFRINTPVQIPGGAFNFNQYLVIDEEPLLFHTGPAALFPVVLEAIESKIPIVALRHVSFSHVEADECGSLNKILERAPLATPVCSQVAAMTSITDYASRAPRVLKDGEELTLGRHTMRWLDTPHLPHSWESGLMMDMSTRTLFCGDLFTQGGPGTVPLTSVDILGPSEAFRGVMDYYSHSPQTGDQLNRLADLRPQTLACMHGSAWSGDGSKMLHGLRESLRQGESPAR